MEQSYRFFSNKACIHFPCHAAPEEAEFNCLFCYCPLYHLGDECGGIFKWVKHEDTKLKLCMDCHLPHTPEYYDVIMQRLEPKN
ncbi:MAG: cysteine-rich small domain-containing protein [Defluviitaleaceae bacterium]|nr:cysteine-rich small domain-containing protein [Defluviitaleaceae bacterium]MCL2238909.1 cysteine-rich small domain-containing protein [Defluviitaleaceae bacterium]MCL2239415.1 cysteine-rich small domain-containing protein [Defluviitaleaceae bacterium]